jgi:hypothetical protein
VALCKDPLDCCYKFLIILDIGKALSQAKRKEHFEKCNARTKNIMPTLMVMTFFKTPTLSNRQKLALVRCLPIIHEENLMRS